LIGNIVARRYARALFSLGKEQGDAELVAYGKNLSGLVEVLKESPQLDRIFRNPVFKVEEKKAVLDAILSKIKPKQMVINFCHLLADNYRLGFLTDIQAFTRNCWTNIRACPAERWSPPSNWTRI